MHEIRLTPAQVAALRQRTAGQAGIPRDTQRSRRAQIAAISTAAVAQVAELIGDPLWVAGTTLYWAEGSKTSNRLSLANSDPRALRLFSRWVRSHVIHDACFVLKLNLHYDNREIEARDFWIEQLDLPSADFYKTLVKPEGTGHRTNHLRYGVCEVRVRRSTDGFHRVMALG